ncbi:MAG: hypothetical protein JRG73_18755 [Deltaproteobacteria bacterium]|nr:hypothetical protein [Deltaproteobacteria bacterium]MBW2308967.1 hypothetical protein [Deltaproteobacteria bacterium]
MENQQNSQCVFVELGIISFKICRKNFTCSQCDFAETVLAFGPLTLESPGRLRMIDQLNRCIQNREERARGRMQNQKSEMMRELLGVDIPVDRFFHRSHVWVLPLSNHQFRLGFDHIAQLLLQTITGVQVSSDKSTGMTIWDLCCMGRMVQIPCPLEGQLKEVNVSVLIDPPRIHEDPYDKGWLIDLELQKEADFSQLLQGEEARAWMAMEMERIRRFDATVMDGGEVTHNPARWIPLQEWRKIVDTFLIQPARKRLP